VVTKTRSPTTTGDDDPRPGISVRQRRFVPAPNFTGGLAVNETPLPPAPRQ